jgi:hypothetical protein
MKNETIKSNGISESMLAPHLRNKTTSGTSASASSEVIAKSVGVCGSTINRGNLVFLGSDDKLYLADKDIHEAEYVAMTSGLVGDTIEISMSANLDIGLTGAYDEVYVLGENGEVTSTAPSTGMIQIIATQKTNFTVFKIRTSLYF